MNRKSIVQAMITSAAIAAAAIAQTTSTGGAVSGQVISRLSGVAPGCCGPSPAVVTGQPYSAQQEVQTIQTLSDGTHITSGLQKVTYYRDSLGRTRIERTPAPMPGFLGSSPADGPPVFITIADPIAGYSYSFDSKSNTAHRSPLPVQISKGTLPALPANLPGQGRQPTAIVAVRPANGGSAQNPQLRPQISNESLGSKTIEGVLAEGHRTTTTWPVGVFGNDRPVTTVNEEWMSRELGINVLSTTSDPRSGEATTRLTNISRAEPDSSLFEPPAGYEIVDPAGQATQK